MFEKKSDMSPLKLMRLGIMRSPQVGHQVPEEGFVQEGQSRVSMTKNSKKNSEAFACPGVDVNCKAIVC